MFLVRVLFLPEAAKERSELVPRERAALDTAVLKLEALGDQLPFPHQSAIKGAANLRELRPRGGRSAWRAFYRQQGKDTSSSLRSARRPFTTPKDSRVPSGPPRSDSTPSR